jgi:pimeloyl-ACP methyl ester carboxylesterase
VLFLHGNPSWSASWSKVIQSVRQITEDRAASGSRPLRIDCIALDLLGFGMSTHLSTRQGAQVHSLENHVTLVATIVERLNLQRVVVVGQDWGGAIAAGVASVTGTRVVGAVFSNTAILEPKRRRTLLHRFSQFPVVSDVVFRIARFPLWALGYVQHDASSLDLSLYRYPFRNEWDVSAPLFLARMVPDDNDLHPSIDWLHRTSRWATSEFRGAVGLAWGLADPVLGPALARMQRTFESNPNATLASVLVNEKAGHFTQEEMPRTVAEVIVDVIDEVKST